MDKLAAHGGTPVRSSPFPAWPQFDETERSAIRNCPFVVPASLGPRILRADTAALAALAIWQSVKGDWA